MMLTQMISYTCFKIIIHTIPMKISESENHHCHRERAPYDARLKKDTANDNQSGNGLTITANVLHAMSHPRKIKE